jgi:hypothetical protein
LRSSLCTASTAPEVTLATFKKLFSYADTIGNVENFRYADY